MKIYVSKDNRLIEADRQLLLLPPPAESSVWIDLLSPNQEERNQVEKFLSVSIPSKEEMQEIESSSRLYQENEALIMTVNAVKNEEGSRKTVNVTFLLKGNVIVTLRYDDLASFTLFSKLISTKPSFPLERAFSLLLGILEAIVEKIADTLENVSSAIEMLSEKIFTEESQKGRDLNRVLITMGQQGEINSKTRDSLSSISRMIGYLKFNIAKEEEQRFESRIETLSLDASDLKDQSAFLGHKISFILDASLGLINIQQNNIIKIFSIAAVVLLPPTLVASVYGMNFHNMPELNWKAGYPLALLLMLLSAILPYLYFKRKGWL